MKKFAKGFTLIELLVVIAIIGILSSVVLASLNTARSKGSDAAIKSQLNSLRAQATIYGDSNSFVYTGLLGDNDIKKIIAGVDSQGAAATTTVVASSTGWAAFSPLKSDSTKFFCVDSLGNATTTTSLTSSAISDGNGCL